MTSVAAWLPKGQGTEPSAPAQFHNQYRLPADIASFAGLKGWKAMETTSAQPTVSRPSRLCYRYTMQDERRSPTEYAQSMMWTGITGHGLYRNVDGCLSRREMRHGASVPDSIL